MNFGFVKYSIFGRYEDVGTTPEQVAQIYDILGKKGFLPNMIQLIQVEQPSNIVKQVDRAQFVNKEKNHIVTIFPDRIDIQSPSDNDSDIIYEYLFELMSKFDLKSFRLAINSNIQLTQINESQLENIRKAFVVKSDDETIVEWSVRRVERKKILDDTEEINSVYQIQYSELFPQTTKVVIFDTDVNTVAENINERYNHENIKNAFIELMVNNKSLVQKLGEVLK